MGSCRVAMALTGETGLHFKALFPGVLPWLWYPHIGVLPAAPGRGWVLFPPFSVSQAEMRLLAALLVKICS